MKNDAGHHSLARDGAPLTGTFKKKTLGGFRGKEKGSGFDVVQPSCGWDEWTENSFLSEKSFEPAVSLLRKQSSGFRKPFSDRIPSSKTPGLLIFAKPEL